MENYFTLLKLEMLIETLKRIFYIQLVVILIGMFYGSIYPLYHKLRTLVDNILYVMLLIFCKCLYIGICILHRLYTMSLRRVSYITIINKKNSLILTVH